MTTRDFFSLIPQEDEIGFEVGNLLLSNGMGVFLLVGGSGTDVLLLA